MSRIDCERREIIDSGSPLKRHSLNQGRLKLIFEGRVRVFPESRKVRMAERRRERHSKEQEEYLTAKLNRILERVQDVKDGSFEGFCEDSFYHELRYLRSNHIQLN